MNLIIAIILLLIFDIIKLTEFENTIFSTNKKKSVNFYY